MVTAPIAAVREVIEKHLLHNGYGCEGKTCHRCDLEKELGRSEKE